ncbi:serine/threonine-protein kinase nekl-2-like [Trichogramma pretiosum]|uniref:serine/threonine-protein kinase nekl-2-like n=1 Tax=Trichogramma pretiosum TaxID=7493 RepID=UPI0006C98BE9|nr:serine/threonine-protein kinase nekl-2-like [Trichogramma pretiosum]
METGNFDFETLLGEGSFGKVYLVKRRKDGKPFVIKAQEQNAQNEIINKMIKAEVECMQILRHPNVVAYHGAWSESSKFFILMEYATNGTLKNLLDKQKSPLTENDAMYLFAQVVLGVNHIHSNNILHRDLKPDNIMLTGRMGDIVKIGDFGLSRDLQESNMSHAGSYYYIAPEMLQKKPYDFKSDIWSLGVILHEMLTLDLAFPATSMEEIIEMICRNKPRLFQREQLDVSKETKIVVCKMLIKEPSRRPTTKQLILCPYLLPFVARVYLNLGRAYSVPDELFDLKIFQPYLKSCDKSSDQTKDYNDNICT